MIKRITSALCAILLCFGLSANIALAEHNKDSILSDKIQKKLELTTEQEKNWDAARDQMGQLREEIREYLKTGQEQFANVISSESAKGEPDLKKVYQLRDNMQQKFSEFRKQRQSIELSFYDSLTPEQKQTIFKNVKERMEKRQEYTDKHASLMD